MTQKEILTVVLDELKHIKLHMPNGELKAMQQDLFELKEDMSEMKYKLLNPEDGVIVKTNINTAFRKEYQEKLKELEDLKRWKDGVTKALWIIFTALIAIAGNLIAR